MEAPTNETEYRNLMARIETFLQKATAGGGFASLSAEEADELAQKLRFQKALLPG